MNSADISATLTPPCLLYNYPVTMTLRLGDGVWIFSHLSFDNDKETMAIASTYWPIPCLGIKVRTPWIRLFIATCHLLRLYILSFRKVQYKSFSCSIQYNLSEATGCHRIILDVLCQVSGTNDHQISVFSVIQPSKRSDWSSFQHSLVPQTLARCH